jgi:hypothetical protein
MFSALVTLQRISLQINGTMTAASLLDWLHGDNSVQVFAGTTFAKRNAPAGLPQVYDSDERILEVEHGEFVDVGGGWINGITGSVSGT